MATPPQRARAAVERHPLPVHHVSAWFWFYPALGSGRVSLQRWVETSDHGPVDPITSSWPVGPFSDTRLVRYVGSRWQHEIASIVDWDEYRGAFPAPSVPPGAV